MTDGTPGDGDDAELPSPASMEIKVRTDIDPDTACPQCGQPRQPGGCVTCPVCGASMCE